MKRFSILSGLLLVAGGCLWAQPQAKFDKTLHEFGPILWKKPASVTFTVNNPGNKPLVISNVTVSCGCTAVNWTKTPIPVNGTGTITATYDAKQLGHFKKSVGVYCNAADRPIYLTMQGEVSSVIKDYAGDYPFKVGAIRMSRDYVEFDDCNRGEFPKAELEIINTSKSVYQPVIMHLPSYLKAESVPVTLSSGRPGKIVFTLDTKKLHSLGLNQTTVYLARFTGDKVSEENAITISAILLPDFSKLTPRQKAMAPVINLSQDVIDLNLLGAKKKFTQTILVSNTGRTTLDISHVQVFNPVLGVSLKKRSLKPGESTKMKITVEGKYLKKYIRGGDPRVLMITNDPAHPKVVVTAKKNIK